MADIATHTATAHSGVGLARALRGICLVVRVAPLAQHQAPDNWRGMHDHVGLSHSTNQVPSSYVPNVLHDAADRTPASRGTSPARLLFDNAADTFSKHSTAMDTTARSSKTFVSIVRRSSLFPKNYRKEGRTGLRRCGTAPANGPDLGKKQPFPEHFWFHCSVFEFTVLLLYFG